MAITIGVAAITVSGDGHLYIRFTDSSGFGFESKATALAWAHGLDTQRPEAVEMIKLLIIDWWMKRDPAGNTPSLVIGKSITLDLLATPPLTIG